MSIDNVSQTSDYSSASERSIGYVTEAQRNTVYHRNELPPRGSNYTSGVAHRVPVSFYTRNTRENQRQNLVGEAIRQSQISAFSGQVKSLLDENEALKHENTQLRVKCEKVEECEKQFDALQLKFKSYVSASESRQKLEEELRGDLQREVDQVKRQSSSSLTELQKRISEYECQILKMIRALI